MRRNREGKHTHLQGKHLHKWLKEAYLEENSTAPPNPNRCIKLVDMIQFMWETRSTPMELLFNMLVTYYKGICGCSGDWDAIGSLEGGGGGDQHL